MSNRFHHSIANYFDVENQSNDLEASVLAEEERYIFKFTILLNKCSLKKKYNTYV